MAPKGEPDPKKVEAAVQDIENIADQLKKLVEKTEKMEAIAKNAKKDPSALESAHKILEALVKEMADQLKDVKDVEKEVDNLTSKM